jgi:hypothetical protein
MATWRCLHKRISLSEQVSRLSDLAQLAFTWAIAHADDWGTVPGSPRRLRAVVFPLRDDLAIEQVSALIDEIVAAGLLVRYRHGDSLYLHFPGWDQYQTGLHKRTARYRLPLPDDEGVELEGGPPSAKFREVPGDSGREEREEREETNTHAPSAPAPDDGAAAEKSPSQRHDTATQTAIREAFEAVTGMPLPAGSLKGYAGVVKLLQQHGLPKARSWVVWLRGHGVPKVPEGADPWGYFGQVFRRAMNREFEWQRKDAAQAGQTASGPPAEPVQAFALVGPLDGSRGEEGPG